MKLVATDAGERKPEAANVVTHTSSAVVLRNVPPNEFTVCCGI